jgi:hypothetical protein
VAKPPAASILEALLERHGQTYAQELGIDVAKGTPSPLFRLLVASILFSARIGAGQAVQAAHALTDAGWTIAERLAATSWRERVRVLNQHGYARYDERTASMLRTAGPLPRGPASPARRGRAGSAARTAAAQGGQGAGRGGVDIFFREAQVAWEELFPFVDRRAAQAARQLGLDPDPRALAGDRNPEAFARLVAALVRTGPADDQDAVLEAARARSPT